MENRWGCRDTLRRCTRRYQAGVGKAGCRRHPTSGVLNLVPAMGLSQQRICFYETTNRNEALLDGRWRGHMGPPAGCVRAPGRLHLGSLSICVQATSGRAVNPGRGAEGGLKNGAGEQMTDGEQRRSRVANNGLAKRAGGKDCRECGGDWWAEDWEEQRRNAWVEGSG